MLLNVLLTPIPLGIGNGNGIIWTPAPQPFLNSKILLLPPGEILVVGVLDLLPGHRHLDIHQELLLLPLLLDPTEPHRHNELFSVVLLVLQ